MVIVCRLIVVFTWYRWNEKKKTKKLISCRIQPAAINWTLIRSCFYSDFRVPCVLGEKLFRFVQLHKKQSRRWRRGDAQHQHENHVSSLKRCQKKRLLLRLTSPPTHHSALNWKRWKIKTKSLSRVESQRQERGAEKVLFKHLTSRAGNEQSKWHRRFLRHQHVSPFSKV